MHAILGNIPEYRYLCPAAYQLLIFIALGELGGRGDKVLGTILWQTVSEPRSHLGRFVCNTRNNVSFIEPKAKSKSKYMVF